MKAVFNFRKNPAGFDKPYAGKHLTRVSAICIRQAASLLASCPAAVARSMALAAGRSDYSPRQHCAEPGATLLEDLASIFWSGRLTASSTIQNRVCKRKAHNRHLFCLVFDGRSLVLTLHKSNIASRSCDQCVHTAYPNSQARSYRLLLWLGYRSQIGKSASPPAQSCRGPVLAIWAKASTARIQGGSPVNPEGQPRHQETLSRLPATCC